MAKTDPIPVRFTEGQASALKRIATACGVGEQDVARWAVEALGAYFDAHNGRLLLPLNFRDRFTVRTEPTILHEPPSRIRSEVVRSEGSSKTSRSERPRSVRG